MFNKDDKNYIKGKFQKSETNLKGYVKDEFQKSETSLKSYVKDEIQKSETNLKDYVQVEIQRSETNLKGYVKDEIQKSETNLKGYVKDEIQKSETSLKSYVKVETNSLEKKIEENSFRITRNGMMIEHLQDLTMSIAESLQLTNQKLDDLAQSFKDAGIDKFPLIWKGLKDHEKRITNLEVKIA